MAARLISRQKFLPGGFRFFQPEINWRAPRNVSFDQIVQGLIRARQANPVQLRKHNWSLDYNAVANEVDEFNAKVCQLHGWDDYIVQPQNPTIPKVKPPNQAAALQSLKDAAARAKELVAGAKTLIEWLDSGEPPVSCELSEHRSIVCSKCPKNVKGDFTAWFTVPASELIKRQIEKSKELRLTTPRDQELNLCDVCKCPLKLKVHTPLSWILKRISPEVLSKLKAVSGCWVGEESELQ